MNAQPMHLCLNVKPRKQHVKFWILLLGLGLNLLAGCGPHTVPAEGEVTLDGLPLDEAGIRFIPLQEQQHRPISALVQQGKYALPADAGLSPGDYRVEFLDLPPLSAGHDEEATVARRPFPFQYTHASPLTLHVEKSTSPAVPLSLNFELTTQPQSTPRSP